MTAAVRRANVVLAALTALALILALALAAAGPSRAAAGSDSAQAAALKKCKAGWNKKKCRCPAAKKRVKGKRGYRCKRRAPAGTNTTDPNTNTGSDPNTNTGTDPNAGNTNPPPPTTPTVQPQRDDAAFDAALSGTLLRRYEEGTYGYGRYAYNFLPNHQLLYCSYYYAGSTVEANKVGTWEVAEGYTAPGYPGYTIGAVRIVGSDFDVRMAVEMYNNQSNVETGNASNVFTRGAFSRTVGGAVTNCSAIQ